MIKSRNSLVSHKYKGKINILMYIKAKMVKLLKLTITITIIH
jgi:hypothetical protein